MLLNLIVIKENDLITHSFDNPLAIIHNNDDMECSVVNYLDLCPD